MQLIENYSLKKNNTFGMNIQSRYFVRYNSVEQLQEIHQWISNESMKMMHIGQGSNLLFLQDYDGVVLQSDIRGIEIKTKEPDSILVRVGAGEVWDDFVAWSVEYGYYGAENLSYIPGQVGAAAYQNIGAYGVEVSSLIERVEVYDFEARSTSIYTQSHCQYTYRNSVFKQLGSSKVAILGVWIRLGKWPKFKLNYGDIAARIGEKTPTLSLIRQAIIDVRKEKLPEPQEYGNAGSYFKNPEIPMTEMDRIRIKSGFSDIPCYRIAETDCVKLSAAWMIEKCGWKGRQIGRVGVSEKHSLILINCGEADPSEIVILADQIITSVKDKFNVILEPEVQYIGARKYENTSLR